MNKDTLPQKDWIAASWRHLRPALVDHTQHVGDQENDEDGAQPNAGASAGTPAAVSVVTSAHTKDQQQNQQ